jgi:hypothetical protein
LPARQARLNQLLDEESSANQAQLAATAAAQKAEQDFDPEKLNAARADHQIKHDRATSLQVSLATEKEKLTKEEKRVKETVMFSLGSKGSSLKKN